MRSERPPLPALPAPVPDRTRDDAPGAVVVHARRAARVAASLGLSSGFALLVADALSLVEMDALVLVLSMWPAALVVWLVAYAGARLLAPRMPKEVWAMRLGAGTASERRALVVPVIALSFALPLSTHAVVAILLGCGPSLTFDTWVQASLILVGHAHVALAMLAGRDAQRLSAGEAPSSPKRTLLYTTIVAAVPGIALWGVPPLLTLLTGALVVPALYGWAQRTLLRERAALA